VNRFASEKNRQKRMSSGFEFGFGAAGGIRAEADGDALGALFAPAFESGAVRRGLPALGATRCSTPGSADAEIRGAMDGAGIAVSVEIVDGAIATAVGGDSTGKARALGPAT
jgi:hypothetical protein